MRKVIYALSLFGLCFITQKATAQFSPYYYNKHEVGVSVQGGYLGLQNSMPYGMKSDGGTSLGVGLHYDYHLSRKFSVGIGGVYTMSNAKYQTSRLEGSTPATDWEGEKFIFKYRASSVNEKVMLNQVNIPLTVAYTMDNNLYFRTGVQFGLSMTSEVETTFNQLETEGYFPQYEVTLPFPEYSAFGSFGTQKEKRDIDVNTRIAWVGEVGYKYELAERQNLYFGLYFDLGLNDIKKSNKAANTASLVGYKPIPEESRAEVVKNAAYHNEAYKLKSYAIGIKVKYGFGL
ncbi:outer membrane beta-barrel protein [Myroides sp. R163-1]|uniref:outer membrane beta-barrel protein n=1 Tax=Myroides sp. R163-1 TaxID=2746738 RepID=UPI0025786347|nr:outer membrane beta-barrel protein [Myroides sp. R163-1]MDM1045700.1 outer membrane beta-barrel protein [Myroides sp. R163-1]